MVENAGDDSVDRKLSVVDYFVEMKPLKVEASMKVEAPIKVEASLKVKAPIEVEVLSVNSGVSKLRDNEVDTSHFFSSPETWKDKDELLGWVRRQANRVGFTVIIKKSCAIRNPML